MYKNKKFPDKCLHWVESDRDEIYMLAYDHEIKELLDTPDEHFQNAKEMEFTGCCNPYNQMTSEEMKQILAERPILDR